MHIPKVVQRMYNQLIFDKGTKVIQWEILSINILKTLKSIFKNWNLTLTTHYTQK